MPNDHPVRDGSDAEQQALALAELIDAAGDDLERNGPMSPAAVRQHLEALEAAWAEPAERQKDAPSRRGRVQPR